MTSTTAVPDTVLDELDLFTAFATDTKAEQEGTWLSVPGLGKRKFLIARVGNVSYGKLLQSLFKRHRNVIEGDDPVAAKTRSDEVLAEVYSKTVLLGWQGAINFKGTPQTYSQAVAKELLMNAEFLKRIQVVAEDFNSFLATKKEEDAKN